MTQRKLFGSVYTAHFVRPCDNLVYFIHSLFFYFTASIMSQISSTREEEGFPKLQTSVNAPPCITLQGHTFIVQSRTNVFFFGLCTNTQPFSALLIHQKYNLNKKKKKAVRNQWMALDWRILLLIVRQIWHLLISSSVHLPSFSLWCRAYA